jgi:hypothetical protein
MTFSDLRERLCELHRDRSILEKNILSAVRDCDDMKLEIASGGLRIVDVFIAQKEAEISAIEAATPVDQRIAEAELLVSEALDFANNVRAEHEHALYRIEQADKSLERAVEAAKQVIAQVAEEQPELRGKVGETGCFQIARGMKYETVKVGEGTPTVTVKFVKSAFNPERS